MNIKCTRCQQIKNEQNIHTKAGILMIPAFFISTNSVLISKKVKNSHNKYYTKVLTNLFGVLFVILSGFFVVIRCRAPPSDFDLENSKSGGMRYEEISG